MVIGVNGNVIHLEEKSDRDCRPVLDTLSIRCFGINRDVLIGNWGGKIRVLENGCCSRATYESHKHMGDT